MKDNSTLANNLISMNPEELKVDMNVKKILSYKPLLARILKCVMSECGEMTFEEIEACIEGDVMISTVPVNPGMTNAADQIVGQTDRKSVV